MKLIFLKLFSYIQIIFFEDLILNFKYFHKIIELN